MNNKDQKIQQQIRLIGSETNLEEAIVYACPELIRPGEYALGDIEMKIPWPAYLIFIDLEPVANWGHACCYVAIREAGNETIRMKAQFSPTIDPLQMRLSVFWKGPRAPDWAVMTYPD